MFIHLTAEQRAALQQVVARYSKRPTFAQYMAEAKLLQNIPAPKPSFKTRIPHTQPGIHGPKPWSAPLFIPAGCKAKDIPEGLALVPIWDSANNHALHNAATTAWTRLWNYWASNNPLLAPFWVEFAPPSSPAD